MSNEKILGTFSSTFVTAYILDGKPDGVERNKIQLLNMTGSAAESRLLPLMWEINHKTVQ